MAVAVVVQAVTDLRRWPLLWLAGDLAVDADGQARLALPHRAATGQPHARERRLVDLSVAVVVQAVADLDFADRVPLAHFHPADTGDGRISADRHPTRIGRTWGSDVRVIKAVVVQVDQSIAVIVESVADLSARVHGADADPAAGSVTLRLPHADADVLALAVQLLGREHGVVDHPVAVVVFAVAHLGLGALEHHAAPVAAGALGDRLALAAVLGGIAPFFGRLGAGGQVVDDAVAVVVEPIAFFGDRALADHALPTAGHALGGGGTGALVGLGRALLVGRSGRHVVVNDPVAIVVGAIAQLG